MFKKKTSLPARPPVPNKEEIIEDLANATFDDVVFKQEGEISTLVTEEIDPLISTSIKNTESYDALNKTEYNNPHQAYLKVASFVEKVNNLEKYLVKLQNGKESLKVLEQGLKADMIKINEELKKQAESPDES